MNRSLLSLYGLKWDPFSPGLPVEALLPTPAFENFAWRIEQHAQEGGFALVTGEPGSGKSVCLRLLAERLKKLREVTVGSFEHPQSRVSDFYREMGDIFGVALQPHNRWGGFRTLRERWQAHIEGTLMRPVLLVDEAQEMQPQVFGELRILASTQFDSRIILTVVFAGDRRLGEKLRREDLLPLSSRIRTRLALDHASPEELLHCLDHLLETAGNPSLMTKELKETLCDRAMGNYRVLTTLSSELLAVAAKEELPRLDEKLFLRVFDVARAKGEKR